jgi:DNA-binding transcriptional LysR family regulator
MDRYGAMEAFVRVVDTGSFSMAARQLHVGQPAVSKKIAELEDRLGVQLLVRSTHGLTPTEAGQNYYERAKRALEEADEAELSARGTGSGLTGRLRICGAVSFTSLHVIPHLPGFLKQNPSLETEIIMDDRSIDLVEDGIDVALRMGTLVDSSLTARKIGQCRRLVLATPDYFQRVGGPATPDDLIHHEAVVLDQPGIGAAWTFAKDGVETAVTVRGRVRITAGEGMRAAVMAGLGLAVTSEWLFAAELADGRVRPTLEDWALPPLNLWAVFPTGRRVSAKARAFVAYIEDVLRAGNGGPA